MSDETKTTKSLTQIFVYQDRPLRTAGTVEDPLFRTSDVCGFLELANVAQAVTRLDADDVIPSDVIDSIGRRQEVSFVTEAGLYDLITTSRKPEARAFKRWVTHDVLPSIRKTGRYVDTDGHLFAGDIGQAQLVERVSCAIEKARAVWASLGGVDAKDEFQMRDWLSRTVGKAHRASGGLGETKALPTTAEPQSVAEVLDGRGLTGKVNVQAIGREASRLFRLRHPGIAQPTLLQRVNGRPTRVNVYRPNDLDLVAQAIAHWIEGPRGSKQGRLL